MTTPSLVNSHSVDITYGTKLTTAYSDKWHAAMEFATRQPFISHITEELSDTVHSHRLVFLIGPYKTGKTSIASHTFPNVERINIHPRGFFGLEDLLQTNRTEFNRLEEIINGINPPEVLFLDEYYGVALELGPDYIKKLAEKTRVVCFAHPMCLDHESQHYDVLMAPFSDVPVVKIKLWDDEIIEHICEIFGFEKKFSDDIVWLAGGMPGIFDLLKFIGGEFVVDEDIISWYGQTFFDTLGASAKRLLTTIAEDGNVHSIPSSLDFLHDFGYIRLGSDGYDIWPGWLLARVSETSMDFFLQCARCRYL